MAVATVTYGHGSGVLSVGERRLRDQLRSPSGATPADLLPLARPAVGTSTRRRLEEEPAAEESPLPERRIGAGITVVVGSPFFFVEQRHYDVIFFGEREGGKTHNTIGKTWWFAQTTPATNLKFNGKTPGVVPLTWGSD